MTLLVFVSLMIAGVVVLLTYLPAACSARPSDPEVAWPLLHWAAVVVAAVATSSILYQRTLVRSGDRGVLEAALPLIGTVLMGVAATWLAAAFTDAFARDNGCVSVWGGGEPAILPTLLLFFGIPCEAAFVVAVGVWVFLYARPTHWY